MNKVVAIKHIGNFKLWLLFHDGASKIIDFTNFLGKGISAELLNEQYFKLVKIDTGGGIEWPNRFDFCPNFLREHIDSTFIPSNN
jgi:hypothetical protein